MTDPQHYILNNLYTKRSNNFKKDAFSVHLRIFNII